MPSRTYSSCKVTVMSLSCHCHVTVTCSCDCLTCSALSVSSMKICWSFSLTKLMQNCSKPFFCSDTRAHRTPAIQARSSCSPFRQDSHCRPIWSHCTTPHPMGCTTGEAHTCTVELLIPDGVQHVFNQCPVTTPFTASISSQATSP